MSLRPRSIADLPGLAGTSYPAPVDRACTEILAREPNGRGVHWIRVRRRGVSTRQACEAIARAGGADPTAVHHAGSRDRHAEVESWFSVATADLEHPGRLNKAGFQGRLQVVAVREHDRPITEDDVVALEWRMRLRQAAGQDGWNRGRLILDRLRRQGCPNWIMVEERGGDQATQAQAVALARRGGGGRDPGARRLLMLARDSFFNHWLEDRLLTGAFGSAEAGDVAETRGNLPRRDRRLEVVDDPVAFQARVQSWEASITGPLLGQGMPPAALAAAERLARLLDGQDLGVFAGLKGGRRLERFRPMQPALDFDGQDLVLRCRLSPEAEVSSLLNELLAETPSPA